MTNFREPAPDMQTHRPSTQPKKTPIFSLQQIASWWLPNQIDVDDFNQNQTDDILPVLPPIQRGFVWEPEQIAFLWDSIARGFPVGSVVLAPMGSETATGNAVGRDGALDRVTHYILDGQQRITSIALGFDDIWSERRRGNSDKPSSALWVDIARLAPCERRFSFYVITRSHPWGYQSRRPKDRLSASAARAAFASFESIARQGPVAIDEFRTSTMALAEAFPWQAELPVPLALLLRAIGKHGKHVEAVATELAQSIAATSLWKQAELQIQTAKAADQANQGNSAPERDKGAEKLLEVSQVLANMRRDEAGKHWKPFEDLVIGLKNAMDNTEIPGVMLPPSIEAETPDDAEARADEHTDAFALFERINTKGTPLTREDINYSMLKQAWPDAPKVIEEKLLKDRQITYPARLVSLLARFVEMRLPGKAQQKPANGSLGLKPQMSIDEFRRAVKRDRLGKRIEDFASGAKAETLLRKVWALLSLSDPGGANCGDGCSFGLPTILAAGITRSNEDLMLILMLWMYDLNEVGEDLSTPQRKMTLAFITWIFWFSHNPSEVTKLIGRKLEEDVSRRGNPDFFNRELAARLWVHPSIIPPLSPQSLHAVLLETGGPIASMLERTGDFTKDDEKLLAKGDLLQIYAGTDQLHTLIQSWGGIDAERKFEDIKDDLWVPFLKRLDGNVGKDLLIYAQRCHFDKWFSEFDPTLPQQVEDRNRPWDWDHLLPQSWTHSNSEGGRIKSEFPYFVRVWVRSIGNYRAWPLEKNRSKGNSDVMDRDDAEISFAEPEWADIALTRESFASNPDCQRKFVKLAIERTVRIYCEWYTTLEVGLLHPRADSTGASSSTDGVSALVSTAAIGDNNHSDSAIPMEQRG